MKNRNRTGRRAPAATPKSKNGLRSQHPVRRDVMKAFEQSVARNRDLLRRLAK